MNNISQNTTVNIVIIIKGIVMLKLLLAKEHKMKCTFISY